jgi:hypothetical protein
MLELIIVWVLVNRIGRIIEEKGLKSGWYKVLTVVLWFGGEMSAAAVGALILGTEESMLCLVYLIALTGALGGAGIAYIVARSVPPATVTFIPPPSPPPSASLEEAPTISISASGIPEPAAYPHTPVAAPTLTQKTNALAITSLILGVLAVPTAFCFGSGAILGLAGLVTGVIGINQINESVDSQGGKGMAITGLVLGVISLLVGMVVCAILLLGILSPGVSE